MRPPCRDDKAADSAAAVSSPAPASGDVAAESAQGSGSAGAGAETGRLDRADERFDGAQAGLMGDLG